MRMTVIDLWPILESVAFTSLEPTLPLHAQDLYNFDSGKAGILFLAIAIPAMICMYSLNGGRFDADHNARL